MAPPPSRPHLPRLPARLTPALQAGGGSHTAPFGPGRDASGERAILSPIKSPPGPGASAPAPGSPPPSDGQKVVQTAFPRAAKPPALPVRPLPAVLQPGHRPSALGPLRPGAAGGLSSSRAAPPPPPHSELRPPSATPRHAPPVEGRGRPPGSASRVPGAGPGCSAPGAASTASARAGIVSRPPPFCAGAAAPGTAGLLEGRPRGERGGDAPAPSRRVGCGPPPFQGAQLLRCVHSWRGNPGPACLTLCIVLT